MLMPPSWATHKLLNVTYPKSLKAFELLTSTTHKNRLPNTHKLIRTVHSKTHTISITCYFSRKTVHTDAKERLVNYPMEQRKLVAE